MKRGGPLARRTPLKNRPPSKPRSPMRRKRSKAKHPSRAFWATRREELYARAGGRCEHRGCSLDELGMQAHHRKLRSQGGLHGLENLTALCPPCHETVHAAPTAAVLLGFIVPSTVDPSERPLLLHDGRLVLLTSAGDYELVTSC
ncbi:MAG: hypothetical protein JWO46_749 [Nocardioidaceae bacterium]|nr:hypothetical protein [Nocardioidaceae bacterium]